VLEDSSGRIRLKDNTKARDFLQKLVTGCIIGALGRADLNGVFHVQDYVFAGYSQLTKLPKSVTIGRDRSIFDPAALASPDRKLVAFISGMEIGLP